MNLLNDSKNLFLEDNAVTIFRFHARSAAALLAVSVLTLLLPTRGVKASELQIIAPSPTLLPGQSEVVSVVLTATQNFQLTGVAIEISFDSTLFSISGAMLGNLDPSSSGGFNLTAPDSTSGTFQSTIDSTGGVAIMGAMIPVVGTLETFTLTALANAAPGGALGDINLLANVNRTITGVYTDPNTNGAIVLTPPPTNGYDAGVDATVIVGAAVPEPSSLLLMGIGGISSLAWVVRKKAGRKVTG